MRVRIWIARFLWSAAASLAIATIAGLLSIVLQALGDENGALAVRGVTLVMSATFGLSIISLVVILAILELRGDRSGSGNDPASSQKNSG